MLSRKITGFRTLCVSDSSSLCGTTRLLYPMRVEGCGGFAQCGKVMPKVILLQHAVSKSCGLRVLVSQQRLVVWCAGSGTQLAQRGGYLPGFSQA